MCNNTIGIDYIGVNTNDLLVGSLQCALKKKRKYWVKNLIVAQCVYVIDNSIRNNYNWNLSK